MGGDASKDDFALEAGPSIPAMHFVAGDAVSALREPVDRPVISLGDGAARRVIAGDNRLGPLRRSPPVVDGIRQTVIDASVEEVSHVESVLCPDGAHPLDTIDHDHGVADFADDGGGHVQVSRRRRVRLPAKPTVDGVPANAPAQVAFCIPFDESAFGAPFSGPSGAVPVIPGVIVAIVVAFGVAKGARAAGAAAGDAGWDRHFTRHDIRALFGADGIDGTGCGPLRPGAGHLKEEPVLAASGRHADDLEVGRDRTPVRDARCFAEGELFRLRHAVGIAIEPAKGLRLALESGHPGRRFNQVLFAAENADGAKTARLVHKDLRHAFCD